MAEIRYWNREQGREEVERIYGEGALRWLYETAPGRWVGHRLLASRWVSRLSGLWWSSRWSRRRVPAFIRRFAIPEEEFERAEYRSFNDFFSRRFRPGLRPFREAPGELSAFAEGRYSLFDRVDAAGTYPVKGTDLTPERILGGAGVAERFHDGPLAIARLCPTDYHRFHFPDDGRVLSVQREAGRLHSVHPVALATRSEIFATNERRVSILESRHFGALAYVEVGAMNVGRIIQTHPSDHPFRRGDEKGYFLFGGSSVLLFGEPGRWRPDEDLLERTRRGQETLVRLGDRIAGALS